MTSSTDNLKKANGRCKHTFWTWLIAIVLAIYLFWQWQHGHGPAKENLCCTNSTVALFNFTATSIDGYNATGDARNVKWLEKSAELSAWLQDGADWKVAGNANHVTLTGTVNSEATKLAKGAEAQALFGSDVSINNQLAVKLTETIPAETVAPSAVKL